MPTPPSPDQPAEPASIDALRAAAQAKALAVMTRLADLTLDLADALHANAKMQAQIANSLAESLPPASMAAYDCIARSLRRTGLTLQHLAQPPRAAPDRVPGRATVRRRVLRAVQDSIGQQAGTGEPAERLERERLERLDSLELDEIARLPLPEIIADVTHDLGLAVQPGRPGGRRRTPADVAALHAWAAAPPGTPASSLPPLAAPRAQGGAQGGAPCRTSGGAARGGLLPRHPDDRMALGGRGCIPAEELLRMVQANKPTTHPPNSG